jgi:hypothetical protein
VAGARSFKMSWMPTASNAEILGSIEAMKRHISTDAVHRPIVKARPRVACATCRDFHVVHYVQDSGTGGYDLEPGGDIPCPDCSREIDESAEALERASFR